VLRFLARFTGYWLIAAALVAAVVDGAKSIAASALVLTPLAETWAALSALGGGAAAADPAAVAPLGDAAQLLFSAPTAAVLGILGFVLLAAGRRRRRPALGREFAA
jgi:hypothetical protein